MNLIGLICATLAALVVFTLVPIAYWSPLARVDMISILLSLAGVWFGLRSIERPASVFPAALFFVLALFAKQTAISAPLTMFFVLLCLRPAMAWLGVLLAAGLELAIFTALTLSTSGEFIKHIIGYNANRFRFGNIGMMSYVLVLHSILLIIVYFSIARFMRELRSRPAGLNAISALRMRAANDRFETVRLFAIVWFGFGALSSLAIVKSGASYNYLLEWMLSWALLVGLALREPARFVIGTVSRGNTAADMPAEGYHCNCGTHTTICGPANGSGSADSKPARPSVWAKNC